MMNPPQKRAGEKQPDPFAKRLRTDPGPFATTTTTETYTHEEHEEDDFFSWALNDESVDNTGEGDPSIVSVCGDLLYTGDGLRAETHSESNLVCYGMVSGRHVSPESLYASTDRSV
jgi:hypothetical protein